MRKAPDLAISARRLDEIQVGEGMGFEAARFDAEVLEELIANEGVVNELTALQMALGAQAACGSDWAVSTTGVAGPTETDGAKVGTVWFAVVGPRVGMSDWPEYTELKQFEGDREQIRSAAIEHAFSMLLRVL